MKIEEHFKGRWIGEEYLIACPVCGDQTSHHHCYINVKKGVFHCKLADCPSADDDCPHTLWWLIKNYSNNAEGVISRTSAPRIPEKKELIDFSKFPPILKDGRVINSLAYKYLTDPPEKKGRGLTDEEIRQHDIRYCNVGYKYSGRILFPIRECGKIVFFTSRTFVEGKEPKYRNPAVGETLLSVSKVIFGYEEALELMPSKVVIVEGIFDAIAINKITGLRGLAILSSDLSNIQLAKLLRLPGETQFFVCLDAEAYKDTIRIAKTLSEYKEEVWVIALDNDDDPASIDKEHLSEEVANAIKFFPGLSVKILKNEKKCR